MSKTFLRGSLIALAILVASPAGAHITLENKEAAIGAAYKAVFVVPHGCGGSATIKIRVQIPEGVIAVEPVPKPGWNVEVVKGKYSGAYDYHGAKLSEGAKEVVWSGGRLVDHTRDQFVIDSYLTGALKPNTTLYFPVVQECEKGINRWIEIPADGADHMHEMHGMQEGKSPAPGVKLMPKP
jgi:uncharacterized protein YcnI